MRLAESPNGFNANMPSFHNVCTAGAKHIKLKHSWAWKDCFLPTINMLLILENDYEVLLSGIGHAVREDMYSLKFPSFGRIHLLSSLFKHFATKPGYDGIVRFLTAADLATHGCPSKFRPSWVGLDTES